MTTMTGEGLADNLPRLVERSSGCCPSLAHLTRPSQIQPRRPKSKPMANDRQTESSAPALGATNLLVKTPGNHREQPIKGANRCKK